MKTDKIKKYKGIKLLKVEQTFFKNSKKYDLKIRSNNQSLNPSVVNSEFMRSSVKSVKNNKNFNKKEEEKTLPINNSLIINTKLNKMNSYNSYNRHNSSKIHHFLLMNRYSKKIEEEKDKKMLYYPYKFSSFKFNNKSNRLSKFANKAISSKSLKNFKNSYLYNKSIINNDYNFMKNNINKTNTKNKNNFNEKKENNDNFLKIKTNDNNYKDTKDSKNNKDSKIIKDKSENTNSGNENNKITLEKITKKLFCCLS